MPLINLTFPAPDLDLQEFTDFLLGLGSLAVSVDTADQIPSQTELDVSSESPDSGWQAKSVKMLLPAATDLDPLLDRIRSFCRLETTLPYRVEKLPERDWVRHTQKLHQPLRIGKRLWIVPTWHQPPVPEAVNIILDPGSAFGTGSHPTTQLCLRWLESNLHGGETVLDYGCGSGILGIAARKLGAARVVCTDIDPLALETTTANARQNQVMVQVLPPEDLPAGSFSIVVANILANPLLTLRRRLADLTAPNGHLVLAGITRLQAEKLRPEYDPMILLSISDQWEDWVLLTGEKK